MTEYFLERNLQKVVRKLNKIDLIMQQKQI